MSAVRRLFAEPDQREKTFLGELFRRETVGGALALAAAVIGIVWANSAWGEATSTCGTWTLGPLDVEHWAADGALTLFFFVAGLELKRELVVGSLRRPADAAVPVAAALCGVAVPALVYLGLNARRRPPGGLGDPGRDRHRLRPGGAGRRRLEPADRVARLPADPRRRRRPGRHRDHRGLLHRVAAPRCAGRRRRRRWPPGACCRPRVQTLLVLRAARPPRLVDGPRVRHPRHDRRRRPGAADPRPPRPGRGAQPGRAARARAVAGLGQPRRAVLRPDVGRGGDLRWRRRWSAIRWSSAWWPASWSASRWASSWAPGWWPGSPAPSWTRPSAGATWSGVAVLAGIGFTVSLLVSDLSFSGAERDAAKTAVLAGLAGLRGARRAAPRPPRPDPDHPVTRCVTVVA